MPGTFASLIMKSAHTIFRVPPHVDRVPAYVRRRLAKDGPKVRIGCAYQPDIIIKASIHAPAKPKFRDLAFWSASLAALMLLGALVFGGTI